MRVDSGRQAADEEGLPCAGVPGRLVRVGRHALREFRGMMGELP